jgi:hypothetical protein
MSAIHAGGIALAGYSPLPVTVVGARDEERLSLAQVSWPTCRSTRSGSASRRTPIPATPRST